MLCALVFIGWGHGWVKGVGNLPFQYCYYDCTPLGKGVNGSWFDRVYRVAPGYTCPAKFYFS